MSNRIRENLQMFFLLILGLGCLLVVVWPHMFSSSRCAQIIQLPSENAVEGQSYVFSFNFEGLHRPTLNLYAESNDTMSFVPIITEEDTFRVSLTPHKSGAVTYGFTFMNANTHTEFLFCRVTINVMPPASLVAN